MALPTDLDSLSKFLGFAPQHLYFLIGSSDLLYREIKIPKRSTSEEWRNLTIPIVELKGVQRAILRKILEKHQVHDAAYAYVGGRSVVTAAEKLCGANKAVLKMDIKDFFPKITSKRVFGLFQSLGFNQKVSYMLTRLTTFKGILCQGSPTSPYISNLISRNMDEQLNLLGDAWSLRYVRYSDDMFLVGQGDFKHRRVLSIANNVVKDNGFSLNHRKTKYSPKGKPRFHLGLATHGAHPQIPRRSRNYYRVAFYKASTNMSWARNNIAKLQGMASWYRCVYGADETFQNYQRIIKNVEHLMLHESYSVS